MGADLGQPSFAHVPPGISKPTEGSFFGSISAGRKCHGADPPNQLEMPYHEASRPPGVFMTRSATLALLAVLFSASAFGGQKTAHWHTDLDAAREESVARGVPMLIFLSRFT